MRKLLEHCPACQEEMIVTEQSCMHCSTSVRGKFKPTIFAKLSPNNLMFLEVFVKNRGNVKEMERELGWSYWTIRNHLNQVITELGFEEMAADTQFEARERHDILSQLEAGEIDVHQASELIEQLENR
jgi:hypothetical protein